MFKPFPPETDEGFVADLVSQLRFSTSKMRAIAIAVAAGTAALVCGAAYFHREPAWKSRVYRVGVDGTPPWAEIGPNGEPGGLAVALLREAARRRGIKLQWVLITGASRTPRFSKDESIFGLRSA